MASRLPVSFFGVAVGLLALANAWRVATRLWLLPKAPAEVLTAVAVGVWSGLLLAYAAKWLRYRDAALAEVEHPVQSAFSALVPVSSLLAAMAVLPYFRPAGVAIYGVSILGQLSLGLLLHGRFWQGGRKPELVTPALYLPTVTQNFVAATAASEFGWPQLGALFLGAGLLSWLAIESLILQRAAVHEALPETLRPSIGIQLSPPVVGGAAYLSVTQGVPDLFAQILLGYGLYQALLLIRLLPWISVQPYATSYWAFSFGIAALPTMAMRMLERGTTGLLEWVAPVLFAAANVAFGILVVRTLSLLMLKGTFLPSSTSGDADSRLTPVK